MQLVPMLSDPMLSECTHANVHAAPRLRGFRGYGLLQPLTVTVPTACTQHGNNTHTKKGIPSEINLEGDSLKSLVQAKIHV